MKIFVFFLIFGIFAFAEPLKLENIELSNIANNLIQGRRFSIKEIIDELLKNIAGDRKTNVPLIEIDTDNSLRDIVIESKVATITSDMDDTVTKINIRNLTVPISLLKVRGEYEFEGISLLDLLIYGRGDIKIDITELKIFLSLKADYKTSRGWKVKDVAVDTSVKDSHIRLENLMDGEPMGGFLNFMIDELFKVGIDLLNGLVGQYKNEIMQVLEKILNSILDTANFLV